MKNKEIWSYLLRNVFWSLWASWIYRNQLYCSVPGLTAEQSVWLLRVLVAAGAGLSFLLTFRNQRNGWNIFVGIVCPIGIYYMISLWELERERIANVMGWIFIFAVCYVVLVVIHYIKDRVEGMAARPCKCAVGCFMGMRSIAALGMAMLLFATSVDLLPMDVAHHRKMSTHPGADRSSHSQLIAENMDELLVLRPDAWRSLNLDQRLEVLRITAEIECSILGIPQVRIRAVSMEANTMGGYDHASRTVTLSLEHLAFDPVEEVLDSVLHEIRHCYQYCLVDLYRTLDDQEQALALFHDASVYAYEFDNYISGSDEGESFEDYFTQNCEVDSNAFAARTVTVYYNAILAHLEESGSSDT